MEENKNTIQQSPNNLTKNAETDEKKLGEETEEYNEGQDSPSWRKRSVNLFTPIPKMMKNSLDLDHSNKSNERIVIDEKIDRKWGLKSENNKANEEIDKYHLFNFSFQKISFIITKNLKQISCGKEHIIILTNENQILVYGKKNEKKKPLYRNKFHKNNNSFF